MSEPKLVSPILDNFIMGEVISGHDGVRCYPAIQKETDEKYIVKIISVPASQAKLDALLLTGACADKNSALNYFGELAAEITKEVEILDELTDTQYFLPYCAKQIVVMDDQIGYDVYLLSNYRQSLSRTIAKNTATHLSAFNLALDLCDALTACRNSGYLYVDLKPNNIFLSQDGKYTIGDLGFLKISSLAYASLPDKYHSAYTAPEVKDAFSSVNTTLDIYALGMILYQIYNGGQLPSAADEESLPSPAYADYEMADIILRACAPEIGDRWETPAQMAQALVSYMQRNGVNDTPIVFSVESYETPETFCEDTFEEESLPTEEEMCAFADETPDWGAARTDDPNSFYEDDFGNLSFIEGFSPGEEKEAGQYEEYPDDLNEILAQADALAAHPVPSAASIQEAAELSIPEFFEEEESSKTDESDVSEPANTTSTEPVVNKRKKRWLFICLAVLLAGLISFGGYYFYAHYYIQRIDSITLDGSEDNLTVYVNSSADEADLSVLCYDTYGNQFTSPVRNGKAVFSKLVPHTDYTVQVQINGFHKLKGSTTTRYTTPTETSVIQFDAIAGYENGSLILGFTINGPDASQWKVVYSADGEPERSATFSSHTVTLYGLTVGKEYTLLLVPIDDLYVTGKKQIHVIVPAVTITVSDFQAINTEQGTLSLQWNTSAPIPEDGWVLQYQIVGTNLSGSIPCVQNNACITAPIPGHTYLFTLQTLGGTVLISDTMSAQIPEASDFEIAADDLTVNRKDLTGTLCLTPDGDQWSKDTLTFKSSFAAGESVSVLVENKISGVQMDAAMQILYMIANDEGVLVSADSLEINWNTMWTEERFLLNFGHLPVEAGNYTITLYFNSGLVAELPLTIS